MDGQLAPPIVSARIVRRACIDRNRCSTSSRHREIAATAVANLTIQFSRISLFNFIRPNNIILIESILFEKYDRS